MKKTTFILFVLIIFLFAGCSNAVETFQTHVEKGAYYKAIEVFNKKILGNSKLETTSVQFLETFLSESVNKYAEGVITAQEFENNLNTVKKINEEFSMISNLGDVYQQYLSIQSSKDHYNDAITAYNRNEMLSALQYLYLVDPADTENYDDAVIKINEIEKKYHDTTISTVNSCMTEKNYSAALSAIDEAAYIFGYTDEFESLISEIYTQKYKESITEAYEDKDYLSVFAEYANAVDNGYCAIDNAMISQYSESVTMYLTNIFASAEEAFGEKKDYSSAIGVLENAISKVESFEDISLPIKEKIEYYEEYTPIYLSSLEYTQLEDAISVNTVTGYSTDVNGNEYSPKTVIHPSGIGGDYGGYRTVDEDEAYVLYYLNKKYSSLWGTIYRPSDSVSCDKNWAEDRYSTSVVRIYGDNVLLYEAPPVTQDTYDPIRFKVDVANVRNLKIVMLGTYTSPTGWYAMNQIKPTVCMAEVFLQK